MGAAPFGVINATAAIADQLDRLAAETGDPRARVAAGILRGRPGGRPACDDADALALAESLVDAGLVRSRRAACRRAASLFADRANAHQVMRRLERKLSHK